MSCWRTLGIEKTRDIREIKRAYAVRLRIHSPEVDPEGFMQLRDSYEKALRLASAPKRIRKKPVSGNISEKSSKRVERTAPVESTQPIDPVSADMFLKNLDPLTEAIIKSLDELYGDFSRRMNPEEWKKLFNRLSVPELQNLELPTIMFLNEHYALPYDVWQYLDAELKLSENILFRRHYLIDEHNDVCSQLIEMFEKNDDPGFDRSLYADLRVKANIAYTTGDWYMAEMYAKQAIDLYTGDYLILTILGAALRATDRERESVIYYAQAFELIPNIGLCYRLVRTYIDLDEYKNAIAGFRRLRKMFYKKKRKEQILSREMLIECEEKILEYKFKKKKILKISYSFQTEILRELGYFKVITPRKYKLFIYPGLLFFAACIISLMVISAIG